MGGLLAVSLPCVAFAAPKSASVTVHESRPPAWSLIATLELDVPAFTGPDGARDGMVSAMWQDRPSALAVIEEEGGALRVPFAQRARCERREPGVAVLHRSEDGLNSAGTINGGLVALAVEEAAKGFRQ
jgi:hypothetical protein